MILTFNLQDKMLKLLFFGFYLLLSQVNGIHFVDFMTKYNRKYDSTREYFTRKQIFNENLQRINAHNLANKPWKLEMNQFGDLKWEEFRNAYVGKNKVNTISRFPLYSSVARTTEYPINFDWVSKGAVTGVKNQGQCGSCWAFSSTGALEGLHYIKTGKLVAFSEQELVDCSGSVGNSGCGGGLMDLAFKYVEDHGICTESSYPYNGTDQSCHKCKEVFKVTGFEDVTPNNESALQEAVYKQPVSIAIEADQSDFQFYSHGVFDSPCGTNLDHGVLAVGWGVLDGKDYWKVKNSWGKEWGDNGYILLARNIPEVHGQCGIAMQPSFPTV